MDLTFVGEAILNRDQYPQDIMVQAMPVMKQMSKNLSLQYATVDTAAAKRDLSSIGYNMRTTSHTETLTSVNPSVVDNWITGTLRDLFEGNIRIEQGNDRIMVLMRCAMDGTIAETKNNFFGSSERSEGRYFSYQMAFYSMRTASYCFLVLSLVAFKDAKSVFGIPVSFKSGISYNVQVFKCTKIHNNVIYNFGRLLSGESMASPNGQRLATLSNDGNLIVDNGRWKSGSAGKGVGPWYLVLQEDANLVIYDSRDQPTWASGSQPGRFPSPPWRLNMQDDGNLVIYNSRNVAIWAVGL